MNPEMFVLRKFIVERQPKTEDDTFNVVKDYFRQIHWSILKDEWNVMSGRERNLLVNKLFSELK